MPLHACAYGSKFCPGNELLEKDSWEIKKSETEENLRGKGKDCNECVDQSLKNDEIPQCFFSKLDEQGPTDLADYSTESYAKKVIEAKDSLKRLIK